ncbi:MAG TPA: DUF2312 domain-containing protein [Dehalococcoidia bacterium]|jgi:uncharacterized protein (UPF0335 family)|nr:DUF2312 domain-containing protein [Dehalococcoidia bacterium]
MSTKETVKEFVEKVMTLENEKRLLREDEKALFEDYKDQLDVKAFRAALRIAKIRSKLDNNAEAEVDVMLESINIS